MAIDIQKLLQAAGPAGSLKEAFIKLSSANPQAPMTPGAQAMMMAAQADTSPTRKSIHSFLPGEEVTPAEPELSGAEEELSSVRTDLEKERIAHEKTKAESELTRQKEKALQEVAAARQALENDKTLFDAERQISAGESEAAKVRTEADLLRQESEAKTSLGEEKLKARETLMDETLSAKESLSDKLMKEREKYKLEATKENSRLAGLSPAFHSNLKKALASAGITKKAGAGSPIPMPGSIPSPLRPDVLSNDLRLKAQTAASRKARQLRQELDGRAKTIDYSDPVTQAEHKRQIDYNVANGVADRLEAEKENTPWQADAARPGYRVRYGDWGVQRQKDPNFKPSAVPSPVTNAAPQPSAVPSQGTNSDPRSSGFAAIDHARNREEQYARQATNSAATAQSIKTDRQKQFDKDYEKQLATPRIRVDGLNQKAERARAAGDLVGAAEYYALAKKHDNNYRERLNALGSKEDYQKKREAAWHDDTSFMNANRDKFHKGVYNHADGTAWDGRLKGIENEKSTLMKQREQAKYQPSTQAEIDKKIQELNNEARYMGLARVKEDWLQNKQKANLDLSGVSPEESSQHADNALAMKRYRVDQALAAAAQPGATPTQKALASRMASQFDVEEQAMKNNNSAQWAQATTDMIRNGRTYDAMESEKKYDGISPEELAKLEAEGEITHEELAHYQANMGWGNPFRKAWGTTKILANTAGTPIASALAAITPGLEYEGDNDTDVNSLNTLERRYNRDKAVLSALGGRRESTWWGTNELKNNSPNGKGGFTPEVRQAYLDGGGNSNNWTLLGLPAASAAAQVLPSGYGLGALGTRIGTAVATQGVKRIAPKLYPKVAPMLTGAAKSTPVGAPKTVSQIINANEKWAIPAGTVGAELNGYDRIGSNGSSYLEKSSAALLQMVKKAADSQEDLLSKAPAVSQSEIDSYLGRTPARTPEKIHPMAISLQNTDPTYFNRSLPGIARGAGPSYANNWTKLLFEAGIPFVSQMLGMKNPYGNQLLPPRTQYLTRPIYTMAKGTMKATYGN